MISLLVTLIVIVVVILILRQLLPMLGLPAPVNNAIFLLIGLIGLLWLLGFLGAGSPINFR